MISCTGKVCSQAAQDELTDLCESSLWLLSPFMHPLNPTMIHRGPFHHSFIWKVNEPLTEHAQAVRVCTSTKAVDKCLHIQTVWFSVVSLQGLPRSNFMRRACDTLSRCSQKSSKLLVYEKKKKAQLAFLILIPDLFHISASNTLYEFDLSEAHRPSCNVIVTLWKTVAADCSTPKITVTVCNDVCFNCSVNTYRQLRSDTRQLRLSPFQFLNAKTPKQQRALLCFYSDGAEREAHK